jgi:hypothetical protein
MVSGFDLPTVPTVFAGELITAGCFRMSAPKAGNGFVIGRIVSSPAAGRNIGGKSSMDSI